MMSCRRLISWTTSTIMRSSLSVSGKSWEDKCWRKTLVVCRLTSGKKKMITTSMGSITIRNSVCYSKGNNGFQISALLQELIVYAGQLECYARCHEVLDKFLSVTVSATQVYRLTDLYGQQLAKTHDFTEP